MSVKIGTPNSARTLARIAKPVSRPIPRKDFPDVRLALSKLALKTKKMPSDAQVFLSDAATCRQSFSLSITHGPAIKNNWRGELRFFQMAASLITRKF